MRVLVAGSSGQLGRAVVSRFSAIAQVTACTHADLDITDEPAVLRLARAERPDVIINCAAYNDVDGAEDHVADAFAHNAFGVLALARAASETGATLVHYGTDFVFDGRADRPYAESDGVNPQSNYARSKLLGEWLAADASRHYVLRVESLFGGARARSSVDRIVDAIRQDQPARVFVDRTVTPSYVEDVAEATARILERGAPFGLYHCVNSGVTTWAGVAEEIGRLLGKDATIVRVSVDEVRLRATRPRYCAMSNVKLRDAAYDMPAWQDALARYLRKA